MVIDVLARQPRIRRANASMTNATYTHPDHVDTYVMSATHSWSGAVGLKFRPTRSRARSAPESAMVVRLACPRTAPRSPRAHQPLDGTAGDGDAFPV